MTITSVPDNRHISLDVVRGFAVHGHFADEYCRLWDADDGLFQPHRLWRGEPARYRRLGDQFRAC